MLLPEELHRRRRGGHWRERLELRSRSACGARRGAQQRALRLKQEGLGGGDLLVCETKDLVKISIRADVFFRVEDPEKAILQVGRDKIDLLMLETSIATLTNIIRSTPLSDIAQSSSPAAVSEAEHEQTLENVTML